MLCVGLLGEASARAETPPLSRSDALIEQGMELRKLGKDEDALLAFEQAAALEPEATRVRVHLAATHQALGHWLEADVLLREVLQESDDAYVQRHRATLERAAEFVGRHLGSLLVTGEPAGAVVQVDGRSLGSLPLSEAVRLPVGAYQLDVLRDGFYPVHRPVNIATGAVAREAVALAPLPSAATVAAQGAGGERERVAAGSPVWLSWTLTGLAAGTAAGTAVAWAVRDQHASRWNSAACLENGRRRGEVCGSELAAGKDAERLAYVGGVASALLAAGAVVSWTLRAPEAPSAGLAIRDCRLSLSGGVCSGSF